MKIPVHNKGDSPMYVAGRMIPPGETEHFEESALPPEMRPQGAPAAETEAPADALAELLKNKVAEVAAALPGLSSADLARLDLLEMGAEKPRKGVLEAIAAEGLRRATDDGDGDEDGSGNDEPTGA